jgi:predicted RNA-binding Zn-ribbon protein involved in translation (DUF1610 family)
MQAGIVDFPIRPLNLHREGYGAARARRPETPRLCRIAFFHAGELVRPGEYVCTSCSHRLALTRAALLPECPSCGGEEFVARAPMTAPRPRRRPLVAA